MSDVPVSAFAGDHAGHDDRGTHGGYHGHGDHGHGDHGHGDHGEHHGEHHGNSHHGSSGHGSSGQTDSDSHSSGSSLRNSARVSGGSPRGPRHRRVFTVGIAGPIGAGKSTLAVMLARVFGESAQAFLEQPMSQALVEFYRDPAGYALALQVQLMNERQEIRERAQASAPNVAIFDRTPEEEQFFFSLLLNRNCLRREVVDSLDALVRRWCAANPYDLVLGLCADSDVCITRQRERDRRGETVDAGYMRALCNQYSSRCSMLYPAGVFHELDSSATRENVLAEAVTVLATRLEYAPDEIAELLDTAKKVAATTVRVDESDAGTGPSPDSSRVPTGGKKTAGAAKTPSRARTGISLLGVLTISVGIVGLAAGGLFAIGALLPASGSASARTGGSGASPRGF